MKKTIALMIGLLLILFLAGCGGGAAEVAAVKDFLSALRAEPISAFRGEPDADLFLFLVPVGLARIDCCVLFCPQVVSAVYAEDGAFRIWDRRPQLLVTDKPQPDFKQQKAESHCDRGQRQKRGPRSRTV